MVVKSTDICRIQTVIIAIQSGGIGSYSLSEAVLGFGPTGRGAKLPSNNWPLPDGRGSVAEEFPVVLAIIVRSHETGDFSTSGRAARNGRGGGAERDRPGRGWHSRYHRRAGRRTAGDGARGELDLSAVRGIRAAAGERHTDGAGAAASQADLRG